MALEQLGPYRIARLLGRGGMGAVYEGIHVETDEHSAVKILSIAFADDPSFRARFGSEVETLKKLRHPNIVQLIGYGEQDGVLFYSMELVSGKNLHEELQAGHRFDWREISDIAIQVCAALKHAHDHGVIHRDLKPANLLWTADGTIKLTDFGIAKLFGSTQLTSAGGVIGTADFMSPEQAEGQAVTPRSDLYSLGAVMYALISGHPPFPGRNVTEVLTRLRSCEPPTLKSLNVTIPQELEDIILQLLRKDPQERIATPMVLAKRLRAMLHGLSVEPRGEEGAEDLEVTSVGDPEALGRELRKGWNDAAWNQETVVTEPQPLPANLTAAPLTHSGAAQQTVATTHYTAVDEEQVLGTGGHGVEADDGDQPWQRIASLGSIVVALAGLAALAWFLTRPPSADQLYKRIRAHAAHAKRGDLLKAREDIDEFLRRYPQDRRSAEVHLLQTDHEVNRLWKRLEREARRRGGSKYLPEVEQAFVEAMREEAISVDSARGRHQSLIRHFADRDDLSAVAKQCLEASRHVEKRLAHSSLTKAP